MSADRRHTAWASASTTSPSRTGIPARTLRPPASHPAPPAAAARRSPPPGRPRSSPARVVDEPLAQPDAVGLVGVDARRGPDHLLGFCRADHPGQALRTTEVGQDPVLVLEQPDRRAAREHADVARERHLQARAEREAAHCGDRGIARLFQPGVRLLGAQDSVDGRVAMTRTDVVAAFDRFGRAPGEHRRVDARRERAAVADHDQRAQVGVVAQLLAERAQLVPHLDRERVELVGTVEPQPSDVAVARELDGFVVGHVRTVSPAAARNRNGRPRPVRGCRQR
jgi:hypothetical protein